MISATLVVLLLCPTVPLLGEPGRVVFYRLNDGVKLKITLICDGFEVVRIPRKARFTATLAVGSHECSDKKDAKRKVQPLQFTLEPNEERFILVQWEGTPNPFLLPPFGLSPTLMLLRPDQRPDPTSHDWRMLIPLN
jgi:hypothetical protein